MTTRLRLSIPFALASAAILALPGVSGAAENASGRPTEPVVNVPGAADRLLELINADRAHAGLKPLASRADVTSVAVGFSRQMATEANVWHNQEYLSQGSLQRLDSASVGENVSRTASVERAHVAFMNSPHHRVNILSPKFRFVGVGVVRDAANNIYVTQDFLTPVDHSSARPAKASRAQPARRAVASSRRSARVRPVPRHRSLPRPRASQRRR
jgi:uncharacterized protein YkwD